MSRLQFVLGAAGLAVAGWVQAWIAPAIAQKWPEKPVTVVMGFPAGSGVDVIARLVQTPIEQDLGTQLVFEYKAGAGGNVASEYVAKARSDGYTILLGTSAMASTLRSTSRCRSMSRPTSRRSRPSTTFPTC